MLSCLWSSSSLAKLAIQPNAKHRQRATSGSYLGHAGFGGRPIQRRIGEMHLALAASPVSTHPSGDAGF
jgi:hypothetical protein